MVVNPVILGSADPSSHISAERVLVGGWLGSDSDSGKKYGGKAVDMENIPFFIFFLKMLYTQQVVVKHYLISTA